MLKFFKEIEKIDSVMRKYTNDDLLHVNYTNVDTVYNIEHKRFEDNDYCFVRFTHNEDNIDICLTYTTMFSKETPVKIVDITHYDVDFNHDEYTNALLSAEELFKEYKEVMSDYKEYLEEELTNVKKVLNEV